MFNFSATMDNSKGKLPFKHAKYQLVRITGFGKNKSRRLVAEKFVPGVKASEKLQDQKFEILLPQYNRNILKFKGFLTRK